MTEPLTTGPRSQDLGMERNVRLEPGYWWWRFRCYVAYYTSADNWSWWIAMRLPKRLVYHAFIRAYAVLGECGPDYAAVCNAWEVEIQKRKR